MPWTQEQIKAERDRLMNDLADANTEVAVVRAKLRGLTARCKHPDARRAGMHLAKREDVPVDREPGQAGAVRPRRV